MAAIYKRIMLKVSGEVLAGEKGFGFDYDTAASVASAVKQCRDAGVQVAVVVGGGNYWRGRAHKDMNKSKADSIGMLATTMNALALSDAFEQQGMRSKVMSAIDMPKIAELFTAEKAVEYLEAGVVLVFACGTGNPCFSTDSGAALRGVEIGADIFFKSTNVDGVYDKDPNKYADAVKYDTLSQTEILAKGLGVMDASAAAICRENGLNALVFNLNDPENIVRAVRGEKIGTIVTTD
ncbi:MAG: UMP kinase [Clostridia bacterium]|nr:UMP kinase [Clostridia bacterium]